MSRQEPITVDFETEAIQSRPKFPPKPVGVAIRHQGGRTQYLAWNHSGGGNNCDVGKAAAILRGIYRDPAPKLFHNAPFDLDVGNAHLGLPLIRSIEDSMVLSFLNDPHERTIALKPMSEKHLGEAPEERDELRDWILEHGRQPNGKKITKKKEWGAYISQAPVRLAKPYAISDVNRTFGLWEKFRPSIIDRGMHPAYIRELDLMPITMDMERSGVRVHVQRLKEAARIFADMDRQLIKAIHKRLKIPKGSDFNVSSGPQLAAALIKADKLSARVLTPKGRQSTKITVLQDTCSDKRLLNMLSVHSVLEKYRNTFIEPWIAQAELTGGRILPKFNQVKSKTDDGGGGTRTGRFSSESPNLQTVTANVDDSKNKAVLQLMQRWLREAYGFEFIGLRDYFLPDEGEYLISTDFNQQELRLLAHFERGLLMLAYINNPRLDIHEFLRQEIYKVTGVLYERKAVKTLVFGILYGMGLAKLAAAIGQPKVVAQKIRNALYRVLPGLAELQKQLKQLSRMEAPIRTYGGREYYTEPSIEWQNRRISFEYKLLNYLIQASAADVTKQAMLDVHAEVPQVRIALQVHDELICMGDKKYGPQIAAAMCRQKFNIPMLADSKYSRVSWARAA